MKSILLLFSLALFLAKTCDEPGNSFALGESFELAIGESTSNKAANLTIKWLEITEDSRCPKNTNCVWEGQAKVQLQVNDQALELILREGKPAEAQALVNEGYIITAESILPYPEGRKIDPTTYRLRLVMTAI